MRQIFLAVLGVALLVPATTWASHRSKRCCNNNSWRGAQQHRGCCSNSGWNHQHVGHMNNCCGSVQYAYAPGTVTGSSMNYQAMDSIPSGNMIINNTSDCNTIYSSNGTIVQGMPIRNRSGYIIMAPAPVIRSDGTIINGTVSPMPVPAGTTTTPATPVKTPGTDGTPPPADNPPR